MVNGESEICLRSWRRRTDRDQDDDDDGNNNGQGESGRVRYVVVVFDGRSNFDDQF